MILSDMMGPEGRVFLKSEWGQVGDGWPCVSFTKTSVFRRLQSDFKPGRDVLLYVGTTGLDTEDPNHRARLISAVVVLSGQMLETRKIVPPEAYRLALERFNDEEAWPHAVAISQAANLRGPPYPSVRELAPKAYATLGRENRGQIVEVLDDERIALLDLAVEPMELRFSPDVAAYLQLARAVSGQTPKSINQEATRMAHRIIARVNGGGEVSTRVNPIRTAPQLAELFSLLVRKWQEDQRGACALCGGPLLAHTTNRMLQASADRIDSLNPAYDDENVQITHLACNWAKNAYSTAEFCDWAATVKAGVIPLPNN